MAKNVQGYLISALIVLMGSVFISHPAGARPRREKTAPGSAKAGAAATEKNVGIDLSVASYMRSYPLAGSADSEIGGYWIFWGQKPEEVRSAADAFYGYLRLFVDVEGLPEYNDTTVGAEFFPISFLGMRLKQTWMQNHEDYHNYSCVESSPLDPNAVYCRANYGEKSMDGILKLGAGDFVFEGVYSHIQASSDRVLSRLYIDPAPGLFLEGNKVNTLNTVRILLGYKWHEPWMFSALYVRNDLLDSAQGNPASETKTLNIHFKPAHFHIFAGLGVFSSDVIRSEVTVLGGIEWNIIPGPEL